MKQYSLVITIVLLALCVISYLLYRDLKREEQMSFLLSQSQTQSRDNSKKPLDPYLENQVKNRIIKGYNDLQECYKEFLTTNPKITDGEIKIDWQIKSNGEVITPGIVLSPFEGDILHKCMLSKISLWEFPPPMIQKYVVHTFKFNKK